MKTQFSFFIALGAALAPLTSEQPAASAATAKAEVASRQYLVGTWHCTFTVGPQAGSYTTTWATALDNLWLTQTYDQAPTGDEPGFVAKYFIGYDERHQAWVRFGAMSTGQYFAIRMTDDGKGGWGWKYVSFFPRTTPETSGSDATFTRKSDTQYTVDGPTYPNERTQQRVTEHHLCTKG